jgi:hypothetical protein
MSNQHNVFAYVPKRPVLKLQFAGVGAALAGIEVTAKTVPNDAVTNPMMVAMTSTTTSGARSREPRPPTPFWPGRLSLSVP